MGDFNPNTPAVRGAEWQPRSSRLVRLDSALKGVAQRFKASTNGALTTLHPFFAFIGEKPGLALEVVDDTQLVPAVSSTTYFPATNNGATTTGWETNTNQSVVFGAVSSFTKSPNVRNAAALASTATLDLKFRGSNSALTTATRVVSVSVVAMMLLKTTVSGSASQVTVRGILDIGGTAYVSEDAVTVPRDNKWRMYTVATWPLSPDTEAPWVSTSADDLWSGTDEFGIRLQGKVGAEGFAVGGLGLLVETCAENRRAYYYDAGALPVSSNEGWLETAMAFTNTVATGQYLWAHCYALTGSAQDYLSTRLLQDPDTTPTTTPNETGEHRKAITTRLYAQGGPVVSFTEQPGELLPILVETTTIDSQSVPYADLTFRDPADKIGGVDLTGASGTYVSASDSAPLSVTGDFEVQALVAADDLTPSTNMALISKWVSTGNQCAFYLELTTNGSLSLWNSTNGTSTGSNYTSSVSLTTVSTNGQAVWVGASLDCQVSTNQRTATFYVSTNSDPNANNAWQTLGSAKTSIGFTAVADTTAALEVGSRDAGTVSPFDGAVYRARLFSGLERSDGRADLHVVADTNSAQTLVARLSDGSIGDGYGNSWTLNGAATFQRYRFASALTTAAATGYVGVRFPVLWEGSLRPDAPLTVNIQTGTEGASGRGTTVATGLLFPDEVPAEGDRVDVLFGSTWTNTLNTQVLAVFSSAATPGKGWRIPVEDTASHLLVSGTTANDVEGASQGGQSDGWGSPEGIHQTRFDVHCALISSVTGASGLAASLLDAA